MTRERALEIFKMYNKDASLLRHAYAVEGVMRYFAKMEGEDEERWGNVGLLHDIDYEMYPEEHCAKAKELLELNGVDAETIYSVQSHGYTICCDVEPIHKMEKILFTIDELTGLIAAAALMRPSKSVMDIELSSVKKKFKDSRFAAGVNRDIIRKGCEMCGFELDYVITETIKGMREVADSIGLGMN